MRRIGWKSKASWLNLIRPLRLAPKAVFGAIVRIEAKRNPLPFKRLHEPQVHHASASDLPAKH